MRKNVLFFTFIGIFLATAIVTLLGITEQISINEKYLNGLFAALLLEVVAVIIGLFKKADFLAEESGSKAVVEVPSFANTSLDISGNWNACYGDGYDENCDYLEAVKISCESGRVNGEIINVRSPDNEDSGKKYSFTGTFKNGELIASYEIADNTKNDSGCFFLVSTNGGSTLKGLGVLFAHETNEICAAPYTWVRST